MKILPISFQEAKEKFSSFFIELYIIHLKTGDIRICNCDILINFEGYNYYPVPIERGSIKTSVDAKINNMDLKISDADNSKISALMQGFDFRGRIVEIWKIQYPDSLDNNDLKMPVFWGYIDAPAYNNGEFSCTLTASFPNSEVPNRTTQYFCNNQFADELCKMSKEKRTVTVNLSASTPNKIKINESIDEDFYKNGLITIGYETKLIKSNTSDGFIITQYPFLVDLQEQAVLERNCDKTPEMCRSYNNMQNYGGFLAIPKEFKVIT